jgi:hypothetical protein
VSEVEPNLVYELVNQVIKDTKEIAKMSKDDVSMSKLLEKYKLEPLFAGLLNKIPPESVRFNENFVETLIFLNANLSEIPSFYSRVINNVINNGSIRNNEEEEGEDKSFFVSQGTYLAALGAHRLLYGPLSPNQK